MKAPSLFLADGRALNIEKRIGKGGEGEVYSILGDSKVAVKYYTLKDLDSRRQKIEAMIKSDLSSKSPLVAFPLEIIKNDRGQFVGFSMMKVASHHPIHELYSPASRRATFPKADYRFLTRVAANTSRAIASVHQTPCVIGDINHSGILVSEEATVTLIDADSFQLVEDGKSFLCTVGVPDFTPPELQGRSLDSVVRTQNHDRFGLAVALFQLLFMGKHPFSGRFSGGDMPLSKSIQELRFAYSSRNTGMQPPPAAPLLTEFPASVRNAFEAAFGPAGLVNRPSAADWVQILSEFEKSLKHCAADQLHYFSGDAKECPWCRMDRLQGTRLFVQPFNLGQQTTGRSGVAPDIISVWVQIEAISAPGPCPSLPPLSPVSLSPSPGVLKVKRDDRVRRIGGALCFIAGAAIFFTAPTWWPAASGLTAIGLFGIFRVVKGKSEIEAQVRDLEQRWNKAIEQWRTRGDDRPFINLKQSLVAAKQQLDGLPAAEKAKIEHYQRNRRQEQLKRHLEGFRIRQTKISGIGPAKLATLASYGIETAADVARNRVLAVPGFGETNSLPLLNWRDTIERRFSYNPNATPQDQQILSSIKSETEAKAKELRRQLLSGAAGLRQRLEEILHKRTAPDPTIQDLYVKREQALTNLREMQLFPSKAGVSSVSPQPSAFSKGPPYLLWMLMIIAFLAIVIIIARNLPAASDPVSGSSISAAALPYQLLPETEIFTIDRAHRIKDVNVRKGPGKQYDSIGKISLGDEVSVIGTATDASGQNWFAVKTINGQIGYIKQNLLAPKAAVGASSSEARSADVSTGQPVEATGDSASNSSNGTSFAQDSATARYLQAGEWSYPGSDMMGDLYPPKAQDNHVEGTVTIDCAVNAIGRVTHCDILNESPAGYGFGEATVKGFIRYAHVNPASVGGSIDGARQKFTYKWSLG